MLKVKKRKTEHVSEAYRNGTGGTPDDGEGVEERLQDDMYNRTSTTASSAFRMQRTYYLSGLVTSR